MTTQPYYGCYGEVMDAQLLNKTKRIKGNMLYINGNRGVFLKILSKVEQKSV